MEQYYQIGDKAYTVTLEVHAQGGYTATIDGRSFRVHTLNSSHDALYFSVDGSHHKAATSPGVQGRWIQLSGRAPILIEPHDVARSSRRSASPDEHSLIANTPAQVVKIEVQAGDSVSRGDTLIVLEAMKMEFRISSPRDGQIEKIHCVAGEVIEKGQLLVSLVKEM
jgi:biotin carboxyl carrier protein